MVSDIAMGSARINDVDVARGAVDAGINYVDTAPDYSDSKSERIVGEAIKGRRDKVFLATKFCVADGHLPNDTPVPKVVEAVEASLRRLQTDFVDLIHVHSCDRVERLLAPNIHEAFDRLKEQGKARFMGVSTHTPNLPEVANAAIDSGRFDVMMLAYHHGMWPHCGLCASSCPEGLPISDVLRHRMYFQDYGWEKAGMRRYAKLDRNATVCVTCAAPCAGVCPTGVPIREKMLDAHAKLTFVG